jgi:hypothetical protein
MPGIVLIGPHQNGHTPVCYFKRGLSLWFLVSERHPSRIGPIPNSPKAGLIVGVHSATWSHDVSNFPQAC